MGPTSTTAPFDPRRAKQLMRRAIELAVRLETGQTEEETA